MILMISVKTRDDTSVLYHIYRIVGETGIRLISSISQRMPEKRGTQTTLLITPPNERETLWEFIRLLKQQPNMEKMEIIELPLDESEASIVGLTLHDFYYLFGKLRDLGTPGEALLFHIGHNAGSSLARDTLKSVGSRQRAVEYLKMYFESLGLGLLDVVRFVEGREAVIRIYDNIECMSMKGEALSRPEKAAYYTSNLIRGMIAGYFEKIFGTPVSVAETRCIVRGDPYCEFVVRPRK